MELLIVRRLLLVLALLLASILPASAWLHNGSGTNSGLPFPLSVYATYANGPPAVPTFFPVGIWQLHPYINTGYAGSYPNLAAAMAGANMNAMLCVPNWPWTFGADNGEVPDSKAAGIYLIGGCPVDYASGVSATSVPSIQSLVAAQSAPHTVVGYFLGDEPQCGSSPGQVGDIPAEVAAVKAYDTTRMIGFNFGFLLIANNVGCPSEYTAAANALSYNSYDAYPAAQPPSQASCLNSGVNVQSDFISVPNDCIWVLGIGVKNMIAYAPTKPMWSILESGSDVFGDARAFNSFTGTVTNGSNVLTSTSPTSGYGGTLFTSAWVGLTVTNGCIPGGTTVLSVTNTTHLVMSAPASCGATGNVSLQGGGSAGNGCLANNLCLPNGNQYRATPPTVNGEVWVSIISGAVGIVWFCHDSTGGSFCLGDPSGGAAATMALANVTYVGATLKTYAPQLNAATLGACSMQNQDFSTSSSCSNGTLTMSTGTAAVPGLAMLKSSAGIHYLFAMSDRNSAAGATMTFTVTGDAAKTATVVYDSNAQYDAPHDSTGATHVLNGSAQFSDTFGANSDHYQVRIYAIQ